MVAEDADFACHLRYTLDDEMRRPVHSGLRGTIVANSAHIRQLMKGAKAWQAWRNKARENGLDDKIDLSRAKLRGANLAKADLAVAKLNQANLCEANLEKTILIQAQLSGANLEEADLRGAEFDLADLSGASLMNAKLGDPSSIPKELEAIVPSLAIPVQPLIEGSSGPYSMFKDYWKYAWMLPIYRYGG